MGTEPVRRRAVSPIAREKCIKRARKEVEFLDKWGRWFAVIYLAGGLALLGAGISFIVLLQHFAQMPGNPQQAQDAMWQGFALGISFGIILVFLLFKGMLCICEGISCLWGKPTSRTLVEYHDTLINLIHDHDSHLSCNSNTPKPHDSLSASESNV